MDQGHLKQKAAKFGKHLGLGLTGAVLIVVTVKAGGWMLKAFGISSRLQAVSSEIEERIGHPIESVQQKVDALARAVDDNERLKLENAHLKLRVESLQFDCHQKRAENTTHQFEQKLGHETGTQVGRVPASLGYGIPDQLAPDQLYVLGVSYFKGGENEKAAAILTFLTGLKDVEIYRNPRDWLMTGVAWYRLDNFEKAMPYFDKVVETGLEKEETQTFHAQALLWKSLIAERTGKKTKAQFWLRELLDHHPYSREAEWVNGKPSRAPAAEKAPVTKPAHGDKVAKHKEHHQEKEHAAHETAHPAHGH